MKQAVSGGDAAARRSEEAVEVAVAAPALPTFVIASVAKQSRAAG